MVKKQNKPLILQGGTLSEENFELKLVVGRYGMSVSCFLAGLAERKQDRLSIHEHPTPQEAEGHIWLVPLHRSPQGAGQRG